MCGKSQYVKTPDNKRGQTENVSDQSEKNKKYYKKYINEKLIEMVS